MKKFFDLLTNILYPPKCMVCSADLYDYKLLVCPQCTKTLPFNSHCCNVCGMPLDSVYGENICISCKGKKKAVSLTLAPFIYKDEIRKAIISLKFYRKSYLAATLASFIFIEILRKNITGDIITFVPIHFLRKSKRGYNQSQLIAKSLSEITGIVVMPLLKKTKNTKPLSKMNKKQRGEAVKNVFVPKKNNQLHGETIILVDDVITTGSTTGECAKILKKMGAGEIIVCAVAATFGG